MQRYELCGLIGEGAYGSVYKARRKCSGEVVAIKRFKDNTDKTNNKEIKRTIVREIKMLRQLQNPDYVVMLQDQFKRRGRIHLVFEYIDQSLLNLLETNPAGLTDRLVNKLLIQLLHAINWCHRNNIIHRDVKPENLLVDSKTHQLKLCDFGFARNLQKDDDFAVTEYVATRWYRAPELLVGTNKHTPAVDIWPVGCIWVEMCSAEPLFPGDSEIDQIYIIQEGLGNALPSNLLGFFKNNAKYAGLSLPQPDLYSNDMRASLVQRLKKQHQVALSYFHTDNRLDLLLKILRIDPDNRISVADAIDFIENPENVENCAPVKASLSESKLHRPRAARAYIKAAGSNTNHHKGLYKAKSKPKGTAADEIFQAQKSLKLPKLNNPIGRNIVGGGLYELLDADFEPDARENDNCMQVENNKNYFLKRKPDL